MHATARWPVTYGAGLRFAGSCLPRPEMDDFWCRYVAATAGVAVLNVDFSAGP